MSVAVDGFGRIVASGYRMRSASFEFFTQIYEAEDGGHVHAIAVIDSGTVFTMAVASDPRANLFVAGAFDGTLNFGGGVLASTDGSDAFIASYSSEFVHRWSQSFEGFGSSVGYAVAADEDGSVYLVGDYGGETDFGGTTISPNAGNDAFVAKYLENGTLSWVVGFGGSGHDVVASLDIGSDGRLFLTGRCADSCNIGEEVVSGMYLVVLDSADGSHLWSQSWEGGHGWGVSVGTDGNFCVTGMHQSDMDFGGGVHEATDSTCMFVYCLDASYDYIWSRSVCCPGELVDGRGVDIDSFGNVYVTGYFDNEANFGGGLLECAGDRDIFVASYTREGEHRWSQRYGSVDGVDEIGHAIAVDDEGGVFVTGTHYGMVDFGGGLVESAGRHDIFVLRLF